jgi:hypothetical protein
MKPTTTQLFLLAMITSSGTLAGDCDWTPMGTGVGPAAYATAVLSNGNPVFGGSINGASGAFVDHIVIWDGTGWVEPGGGVDGFVRTILALPDGGMIAGGQFHQAGQVSAGLIAKWDGTEWSALGLGLDAGSCRALLQTNDGDIIAAGSFLQADEQPAWGIAKWDGTQWTKLGNNTIGGGFAGWFTPEPSPTMALDLAELPNGDIVACGNFTEVDGMPIRGIARWDGNQWHPLGTGTSYVARAMTLLPNGDLMVTGTFAQAGGVDCNGIAIWDGTSWSAVGEGFNGINQRSPWDLETTPDGKVILSGAFDQIDSVPANNIALYDPASGTWAPIGTGMALRIQTSVWDVAVDPDGVIYAGGQFISAGGNSDAWNVAKFDCNLACLADLTGDGQLDFFDVSAFLNAFTSSEPSADFTGDGTWDFFDVSAFLNAFNQGCP